MLDRIEASNTESFQRYVENRQPCIITSIPKDLQCFSECINLSFLEKHAGHAAVSVEPISSKGTFGTAATKQNMSFSRFLAKLADQEQIYLTTQYTEELETAVLNEPLKTLWDDYLKFPIIPKHAGKMITDKINIWLGASQIGTTSGLHHDFHDNFYILLSGRKKFRIFKPTWKACQRLKIYGKPHEIHENGLISYNASLGADGISLTHRSQLRVNIRDSELREARRSGLAVAEAEARYEDAMEQLLEAKLTDRDGSEDGDFMSEAEDDETSSHSDDASDDERCSTKDNIAVHNNNLPSGPDKIAPLRENGQVTDSSPSQSQVLSAASTPAGRDDLDLEVDSDEPPSFSSLSTDEITALLQDEELCGEEFVLEKGELLYLPASYFHEVISMSGEQNFHMAVNYWFFPPDGEAGQYTDIEVARELKSILMKDYPLQGQPETRPVKRHRTTIDPTARD